MPGERKSAQQVADENLATAERVHEKAVARVEKTKQAHEKAVEDEKFAARKVRAAKIIATDEAVGEIDPDVTPAQGTADDADQGDDIV